MCDWVGDGVRIYAYLALAAALAGLLWHDHWLGQRLKAQTAKTAVERQRADTMTAQVAAEKAARVHEQRIAQEASNAYQNDLQRIRDESRAKPLRLPVRACLPGASSAATAATGADAAGAGRVEEDAATEDRLAAVIGEYTEDCEANAAQLNSLIQWARSR